MNMKEDFAKFAETYINNNDRCMAMIHSLAKLYASIGSDHMRDVADADTLRALL